MVMFLCCSDLKINFNGTVVSLSMVPRQSLTAAVQAIGSEFVLGYIQAMDGERNPRNLLTVFTAVPTIIEQLPFGNYN